MRRFAFYACLVAVCVADAMHTRIQNRQMLHRAAGYDIVANYFNESVVTNHVYFALEKKGLPLGRVVFAIFGEVVPRVALNFITLATDDLKRFVGMRFDWVLRSRMAAITSADRNAPFCGMPSIYGNVTEPTYAKFPPGDRIFPAGYLLTCGDTGDGHPLYSNVQISMADGGMSHNENSIPIGKVIYGWDMLSRRINIEGWINEIIVSDTGCIPVRFPYKL